MVSINYSSREVCCKIVYYGPGLSGKTTNLLYVHSKVPSGSRGKMISLATEADRTLYFDFLPINIGTINGFAAKFQLYTVPGQVYYNATRKLVLRGVDGVVFVADSQPDKMEENIESLSNLEENLKEYGYDLNDLPMVIQYNKNDLPGILSKEELDAKLNTRNLLSFPASATVGNGVFDTLKMIIKLVLDKAKNSASGQAKSSQPTVSTPEPDQPAATQPEPAPLPPQPVSQAYSESSSDTEGTMPSTTAVPTATATAPAPVETETKEDVQSRPYPGSVTGKIEQKKIPSAAYTPIADTENDNDAMGQKILEEGTNSNSTGSAVSNAPTMAPSLKRRKDNRRGFFNRLFGIK